MLQIQTTLTEIFGNESPALVDISDVNSTTIKREVIKFATKKREYPKEKIKMVLDWLTSLG